MCEKIERAHLRKLSAGKSPTIMTTSRSEFSLAFLDKDIDILTTVFEEPMLERGKTLLANSLAHVSARKLLNDALTEEFILENIKAGENTDFWLNEIPAIATPLDLSWFESSLARWHQKLIRA